MTGYALQCADCGRVSTGRATGWMMRIDEAGHLRSFCPDCD